MHGAGAGEFAVGNREQQQFGTGGDVGARTDTIMVLHMGDGKPTLMSIPRDSYVNIPGHGMNKINAAYNFGGPQLLAKTIEQLTGIRIDHYAEIGFGGFDTLVDAVGGVNICIDQSLRDPKAGLNLTKGCHDLNGQQALGLVRTRAFPNADLERVVTALEAAAARSAKARKDRRRGGAVLAPVTEFLTTSVPFHTPLLASAGPHSGADLPTAAMLAATSASSA